MASHGFLGAAKWISSTARLDFCWPRRGAGHLRKLPGGHRCAGPAGAWAGEVAGRERPGTWDSVARARPVARGDLRNRKQPRYRGPRVPETRCLLGTLSALSAPQLGFFRHPLSTLCFLFSWFGKGFFFKLNQQKQSALCVPWPLDT